MAFYECSNKKHTITLSQNGHNDTYYSTNLYIDGVSKVTIINGGYNVFKTPWTITI